MESKPTYRLPSLLQSGVAGQPATGLGSEAFLIKRYRWDALIEQGPLKSREAILARLLLIQQLLERWAPQMRWSFEDKDELLFVRHVPVRATAASHLARWDSANKQRLADWIAEAHTLGVVHGNLHPKHMAWTDSSAKPHSMMVYIIDWEPNPCTTTPWVDPMDLRSGEVSLRTDWLCLYRLWGGFNAPGGASKGVPPSISIQPDWSVWPKIIGSLQSIRTAGGPGAAIERLLGMHTASDSKD